MIVPATRAGISAAQIVRRQCAKHIAIGIIGGDRRHIAHWYVIKQKFAVGWVVVIQRPMNRRVRDIDDQMIDLTELVGPQAVDDIDVCGTNSAVVPVEIPGGQVVGFIDDIEQSVVRIEIGGSAIFFKTPLAAAFIETPDRHGVAHLYRIAIGILGADWKLHGDLDVLAELLHAAAILSFDHDGSKSGCLEVDLLFATGGSTVDTSEAIDIGQHVHTAGIRQQGARLGRVIAGNLQHSTSDGVAILVLEDGAHRNFHLQRRLARTGAVQQDDLLRDLTGGGVDAAADIQMRRKNAVTQRPWAVLCQP